MLAKLFYPAATSVLTVQPTQEIWSDGCIITRRTNLELSRCSIKFVYDFVFSPGSSSMTLFRSVAGGYYSPQLILFLFRNTRIYMINWCIPMILLSCPVVTMRMHVFFFNLGSERRWLARWQSTRISMVWSHLQIITCTTVLDTSSS
jgi:hypothetical protein